jgi:hypothetical protein
MKKMVDKNEKWEPVENLDHSRRTANDWANIYGICIDIPNDGRFWSEYEWAYYMCNADYLPKTKDFERLSAMEMRALELRRDMFVAANINEREVLVEKYIETDWVRKKLNVLF